MSQRNDRLLPLCLAFGLILLASLAWLILGREGEEELDSAEGGIAGTRDAGARPQRNSQSTVRSKEPASVSSEAGDAAPATAALEPLPAIDFGSGINRGGGLVNGSLLDHLLQSPELGTQGLARLWRQLGRYWHKEDVEVSSSNQRFTSGGLDGAGLEPGDYEALVSLGSYGIGSTRFTLGRGESGRPEIDLPGFTRVVRLRVIDQFGEPLPFISTRPRFEHRQTKSLPGHRHGAPNVLRNPPGPLTDTAFGMGGSGSSSFRSRRGKTKWATEDGGIYVKVVAGVGGKIVLPCDQSLVRGGNIVIKSDFVGGDWDDYQVLAERVDGYGAKIESYRLVNSDDPVQRSLIGYRPAPPATGEANSVAADPSDLENFRKDRVRLVLRVPRGFRAKVWDGNRMQGDRSRFRTPTRRVFELRGDQELEIMVDDGRLGVLAARQYRLDSSRLQELDFTTRLLPFRLTVTASPTITAWTRFLSLGIELEDEEITERMRHMGMIAPSACESGSMVMESFLNTSWSREKLENGWLVVALSERTRATLNYRRDSLESRSDAIVARIRLTGETLDSFLAGRLAVDLADLESSELSPHLIFRAVGQHGEGLPWVQGSVMDIEMEEVARSLQGMSQGLAQRSKRPSGVDSLIKPDPNGPPEPEEEIEELEFGDFNRGSKTGVRRLGSLAALRPTLSRESALSIYGRVNLDTYGLARLDRLHRFNAWYDTFRKTTTDAHGYTVARSVGAKAGRIEAGRRYVLYLWSNSRDDLVPDGRVVFDALEGTTDLGLIRLPSYR